MRTIATGLAVAWLCLTGPKAVRAETPSAAVPANAPTTGVHERSRVSVEPGPTAFTELWIDNPLGDVRVEGYDGKGLQIVAIKHAPDARALERLRVSLVADPAGPVRLVTTADRDREAPPVARSAMRIDLVIQVPRDVRIDARVADATLRVENLDAGARLDAVGGKIEVANVGGAVTSRSISAPQSFANVYGQVDAESQDGGVEFDVVRGATLVATVQRGTIAARRVTSQRVEFASVSGGIRYHGGVAPMGMQFASVRGDVEVRLAHGAARVRARGKVVELPGAVPRQGWQEAVRSGRGKPPVLEFSSRHGRVRVSFY